MSKDRIRIRTPSAPTGNALSESPLVALVTGANRGIGFEICRQLAARRFAVLLTARDAAKARAAATKLAKVGTAEPLPLDVADANSIKDAAAEVASRHGRLDVLINNAGINYDTWETVENADINGTVMETIATNLLGPWRLCQAFLPLLRKSQAGRIVNVSSESGSLAEMGPQFSSSAPPRSPAPPFDHFPFGPAILRRRVPSGTCARVRRNFSP